MSLAHRRRARRRRTRRGRGWACLAGLLAVLLSAGTALAGASTPAQLGAGTAPAGASTPGSDGAPASLEALMEGMAGTPGVVARFREVKDLALLSEPLESRGTLYFVPPDRLARITRAPAASRLVIDGGRVLFRDAAGGEAFDLSANPVAREYVSNFIVLFNGDLDALRARYEPAYRTEGGARWTLELRPRHRPLSELVERVTLHGEGRALTRLELRETDGDRTTTYFEDVDVDHHFESGELERIFSPGESAGRPEGGAAPARDGR